MSETFLSEEQWAQYERDGFVNLGRILSSDELSALQTRIDDIMLGRAALNYNRILMQLDSNDGEYQNAGEMSRGHKGATLDYRKIQDLEYDALFLEYMQRPIFQTICAHIYGEDVPIAAFRAMFMNKPARKGTMLPWHQDRWNYLDRDPMITIWTALDPATKANGCVQVIRGSHKLGLLNPEHGSGFLSQENISQHIKPENIEFCELEAGEAVLMHNWLLHSSDKNETDISRRAYSVCYMDANTISANSGEQFTTVFGAGAIHRKCKLPQLDFLFYNDKARCKYLQRALLFLLTKFYNSQRRAYISLFRLPYEIWPIVVRRQFCHHNLTAQKIVI